MVILAAIVLGLGGFAMMFWRSEATSPLDEEVTNPGLPDAPAEAAPADTEGAAPPESRARGAGPNRVPPDDGLGPPPPRRTPGPAGPRPQSCRISGQVVGSDGEPVGGAQVYVMKDARHSTGGSSRSEADGRFEIERLSSRHYFGLGAQYRPSAGRLEIGETVKPFYLVPGAHREGEVIRVGGTPLAGGWIHLEDGRPVEGRSVTIRSTSDKTDFLRALGVSSAADGTWVIHGRTAKWKDGEEIEVCVHLTAREGEDYVVLPASRRRCFVGDAALDFTIVLRRPEAETTIRFVSTGADLGGSSQDHPVEFRVLAGEEVLCRGAGTIASGENLLTACLPVKHPGSLTLQLSSILGSLRCPLVPEGAHRLFGEGGSWQRLLRVSGTLLVEGVGPFTGTAVAIYARAPRDLPSNAWSIFPGLGGEPVTNTRRQLPPRRHPPFEIVACSTTGRFEARLPPGAWWLRAERALPLAFWKDGTPSPWMRIVLDAEDLDLGRLAASSKR